jgi:hypothetical protein
MLAQAIEQQAIEQQEGSAKEERSRLRRSYKSSLLPYMGQMADDLPALITKVGL